MTKRPAIAVIAAVLAFVGTACGGDPEDPGCTDPAELAFDLSGAPLSVGSTGTLSAFERACGERIRGVAVTWTLSPDTILRLEVLTDSTARVTAVNAGNVLIRARAHQGGRDAAAFITLLGF